MLSKTRNKGFVPFFPPKITKAYAKSYTARQKGYFWSEMDAAENRSEKRRELSRTFLISENTLKSLYGRHSSPATIKERKGRASKFNNESIAAIAAKMRGDYDPSPAEMDTILIEAAESTCTSQGKSVASATFCKQTRLRLEVKMKIKSKKAEKVTAARHAAAKDYFNFVTYAVMSNWVESKLKVEDCLHGNFDGSSFTVGGCGADNVIVKALNDIDMSNMSSSTGNGKRKPLRNRKKKEIRPSSGHKAAPTPGDSDFQKYTVKIQELIMASGIQSTPTYILADSSMTDSEFKVYKVPGLGTCTNVENYGNVIITKTRCMNRAAYKWYYLNVLIPLVDKIREISNFDALNHPSFFHFDGEDVQLQALMDNEVAEAMTRKNIWFGKVPGSSTHKTQACDVKHIFKGTKSNYVAAE